MLLFMQLALGALFISSGCKITVPSCFNSLMTSATIVLTEILSVTCGCGAEAHVTGVVDDIAVAAGIDRGRLPEWVLWQVIDCQGPLTYVGGQSGCDLGFNTSPTLSSA